MIIYGTSYRYHRYQYLSNFKTSKLENTNTLSKEKLLFLNLFYFFYSTLGIPKNQICEYFHYRVGSGRYLGTVPYATLIKIGKSYPQEFLFHEMKKSIIVQLCL